LFDHYFLPAAAATFVVDVAIAIVFVVAIVFHLLLFSVVDPDCFLLLLPPSMEYLIPHCAYQILHDPTHGI